MTRRTERPATKHILRPPQLGNALKLGSGFSRYENITGIYLDAGENVVFVGDTGVKQAFDPNCGN
ncbi:MAG: hypothetical protein WBF17_15420 [Phycisphaerae bacterium]